VKFIYSIINSYFLSIYLVRSSINFKKRRESI